MTNRMGIVMRLLLTFGLCTTGALSAAMLPGDCSATIAGYGPGYYWWSDCSPIVCETGCQLFDIDRGNLTIWFCECGDGDPAGPDCCDIVMMEIGGYNYPAGMGDCWAENNNCPCGECTPYYDVIGGVEYWDAECR